MRICLISREFPPDTGFGGIATFAKHLAYGLKDLGHDVVVISMVKDGEAAKTVTEYGITVHRVEPYEIEGELGAVSMCMPVSRFVLRATSALWYKFFEVHEEKPFDVVDTPELLAEGLVPAITKAVPLLIRLYTPHSKFMAEGLHNVSPTFDHQFVAMLERIAMRCADVITSPSEDLADFVANDMNYPREQIQIVRNPIDPEVFAPQGEVAIAPDGRKTVLFVGRLEERKGVRYLVEAIPMIAKRYSNVRFIIIGDDTVYASGGKTSMLALIKELLSASGCLPLVQFIDRVPLTSLPDYYRSADVCVVPSVYDNSPYTCLEAMSCGRAVIGSFAGGTREYMTDGESGLLVPPRDPSAIADAVVRILSDEKEQKRLGENARARVLEKFQRKEIARQTTVLYDLAKARFNASNGLYLKESQKFTPDADAFMYSFDKMIYDLLYQQSYRFRLRHWFKLGKARPRLFGAIVVLAAMKTLGKLFAPQEGPSEAMLRLEQEIKLKQRSTKASSRNAIPGSAGVSPASSSTIPGSAGVPPASSSAIPGSAGVPPASSSTSAGSAGVPPASSSANPGSAGVPPASSSASANVLVKK